MATEESVCKKCGKSKEQKPHSLTQWISVCKCNLELESELPPELSQAESVKVCSICGKIIGALREGSLTQWVFRSDSCRCKLPVPKSVRRKRGVTDDPRLDAERPGERDDKSAIESETELVLDDQKFPTDLFKPIEKIASGSSGDIYKCRNRLLGQLVAVKILRVPTDDQIVQLQQEAKTASRLNHPNIVQVVDFGMTDGQSPYMVTEFIRGTPLSAVIRKFGRVDLDKAIDWFIQMCDGLGHAHSRGILHRDISPNNILVVNPESQSAQVKIIDFGLALLLNREQFLTAQGLTLVGTPAYMSPDQALGKAYDESSELYSLGCIMFETLVGRPPFEGTSALELLALHAESEIPSATEIVGAHILPSSVDRILRKSLSKEPRTRYQSCDELKADLLALQSSLNETASKAPTRGVTKKKWPLYLVPFLVLLLLASSYPILMSAWLATQADKTGMPLVSTLATLGNQEAQFLMGIRYFNGAGVKKDTLRAMKLFEIGAQHGHIPSIGWLGSCYTFNDSKRVDLRKGRALLLRAAEQQYLPAERWLGLLDLTRGDTKWLQIAADHGDPYSKVKLAMSLGGLSTDKSNGLVELSSGEAEKKLFTLMEEAARAGLVEAQYNLGILNEFFKHDTKTARYWYRMAADKGEPSSQFRLGLSYAMEMRKKSAREAFRWFKKGATNGHYLSMIALSACYRDGNGTNSNKAKADFWYRKGLPKFMKHRDLGNDLQIGQPFALSFSQYPFLTFGIEAGGGQEHVRADDYTIQLGWIPDLKSVSLANFTVTEKAMSHLTKLPIQCLTIYAPVSNEICSSISKIKTLKVLTIGNLSTSSKIDAGGMRAISQLPDLRYLCVNLTNAQPDTISPLANSKSLEYLFFASDAPISLQSLQTLPRLRVVVLEVPRLTASNLEQLSKLPPNVFLELNLLDKNLTDKDILELARLPILNLTIYSGKVSDAALLKLGSIETLREVNVINPAVKNRHNLEKPVCKFTASDAVSHLNLNWDLMKSLVD